jgi:hypothetical protein
LSGRLAFSASLTGSPRRRPPIADENLETPNFRKYFLGGNVEFQGSIVSKRVKKSLLAAPLAACALLSGLRIL